MKYAIAAVKGVILNNKGWICAIEQNIQGSRFLDLPGGKIESGEDPIDALKREVKEEVGLEVKVKGCLGLWWFTMVKDPRQQIVCATYVCETGGGDLSVDTSNNPSETELEETEAIVWLTKDQFLAHPGHQSRGNTSLVDLVSSLHV